MGEQTRPTAPTDTPTSHSTSRVRRGKQMQTWTRHRPCLEGAQSPLRAREPDAKIHTITSAVGDRNGHRLRGGFGAQIQHPACLGEGRGASWKHDA